MALISCPECSQQISDKAPNCIRCGFPLPKKVTSAPQLDAPVVLGPAVQFRQGFPTVRKFTISAPGTTPLPAVVETRSVATAPTHRTSAQAQASLADAVRAGATQADYNKSAAALWFFQVLVIAGITGFASSSWVVFGVVLLLLAVLINIPFLGKLVGFASAAAFGFGIFEIGKHFGSPQAGAVIGAIVGISLAFGNAAVRQYSRDLNSGRKN